MVWTVARYALESFMAGAVVARLWMCCQGHVAHGTSWLHHSVPSTRFICTQPRASGPQCINCVKTCTSGCNLYLSDIKYDILYCTDRKWTCVHCMYAAALASCRYYILKNAKVYLWWNLIVWTGLLLRRVTVLKWLPVFLLLSQMLFPGGKRALDIAKTRSF